MTVRTAVPHRRRLRRDTYDYRAAGAYFVTICTQDRRTRFGSVVRGKVHMNNAGLMVSSTWGDIPTWYPGIGLDAFVVMPDHLHAIVTLFDMRPAGHLGPARGPAGHLGPARGPAGHLGPARGPAGHLGPARGPAGRLGPARGPAPTVGLSLGDVVGRFKSLTTNRYADGVRVNGWPPFRGRLWQRGYHDHIIRDVVARDRIRRYIQENPSRWTSAHP